MGMAASQARFLTLTARKSNVEYEGQQVNQQRTSLANESAGLFNKMMALQVPTPPSATDFYNTRYTFDSRGAKYSIAASSPRNDGTYDLSIVYTATVPSASSVTTFASSEYTTSTTEPTEGEEEGVATYNPTFISFSDSTERYSVEKLVKDEDGKYYYTDSEGNRTADLYVPQIVETSHDNEDVYYRFKKNNVNYYVSKTNMDNFIAQQAAGTTAPPLTTFYATTEDRQQKIHGVGTFPSTTEEGRFGQILISSVDTTDENLQRALVGTSFSLSLVQVQDDIGYEQAMKDYEYQKMLYERTINDINAQTEIIQQQDRTLELRLKQLDTEQEALNTELEAVKKVIETNVQATFKTFA